MTTSRGLLMVWTNIPEHLEADFNEWYNREHMPERILDLDGFVRGRRFVAYAGGPRYLALYDTLSIAAFHSEPYLALKRDYDPLSRRFVPKFQDTVKVVAQVSAQAGAAEGSFLALLPIARSADQHGPLRNWIASTLLAELLALNGVVSAWYAERNDDAMVMAKQDHLRGTDRILDGMLVIEATSNEALDAAALVHTWDRIGAQGGGADVPAARLRNIYSLHSSSALQLS
ncbi:MAG: hypothetical protein ACI8W7_002811 [Gammaproteobacteria bacterium]|jgi:hypothetical protein